MSADIKKLFSGDHFAATVGIELREAADGRAMATLVIEQRHLNAGGVAQGGAIFTLADLAMAAAANSRGRLAFSVQSDIKYLVSALPGEKLMARSSVVSLNNKISNYKVEITGDNERLIATATALFYRKDITHNL